MRNFIFYYNHLKNHLSAPGQWVFDENDPEIKSFMETPFAKHFNGYAGITYMLQQNIFYDGFFIETPTGIGVTEFSSLTSFNDSIRDRISIPPVYNKITMLSINRAKDQDALSHADFLVCEKKEGNTDLYMVTAENGLRILIQNAINVEVAETETVYEFFPNMNMLPNPSMDLNHVYTKLKSLKVEKMCRFSEGIYNAILPKFINGENLWEAEFKLAYWDDAPVFDKYSMKYSIENKVFEKFKSCIKDNVCILDENPDRGLCANCIKNGEVKIEALVSIEKLLKGEYIKEHKEYSDFFTDEVLKIKT